VSNETKPLSERIEAIKRIVLDVPMHTTNEVLSVLNDAQAELARLMKPMSDEDLEPEYDGILIELWKAETDEQLYSYIPVYARETMRKARMFIHRLHAALVEKDGEIEELKQITKDWNDRFEHADKGLGYLFDLMNGSRETDDSELNEFYKESYEKYFKEQP